MAESTDKDRILSIDGLTLATGGDRPLDQLSLDVYRGERLGVISNTQSGASALASALLNEKPDGKRTGDVFYYPVDGEPRNILQLSGRSTRQFRWKTISIVQENPANSFNPTIPIRRHVTDTLKAHGVDVREGVAYAETLLSTFGLDPDEVLDAHPDDLSKTTKEWAALMVSLVLKPEILILREFPATFRSSTGQSALNALEPAPTVLLLGTDLLAVASFATRIAVMYNGKIVEEGSIRELLEDPQHPYTQQALESAQDSSLYDLSDE